MHTPPIIGVAFAGSSDYVSALTRAGAQVRSLDPNVDTLPTALDGLDGVLLTGGPDVEPSLYGAVVTHPTVEVTADRDAYELPLAKAALERHLPLLAICRGVQVLNVAAGGTLIQDLPSERPSGISHSVNTPKSAIAHTVNIVADSRLAGVVGEQRLDVNSRHHQAIDRIAPGFVVSATAPDGVIEAIEPAAADDRFCIGVQWHPENFWKTGESASLFQSFVDAAARRT